MDADELCGNNCEKQIDACTHMATDKEKKETTGKNSASANFFLSVDPSRVHQTKDQDIIRIGCDHPGCIRSR
jgi:hypothetical protein